jgi:hypothetical protein
MPESRLAPPFFWYVRFVERPALAAKLDKLLAMRGDPVKGLPATVWAESLEGIDRPELLRAVIEVVRKLLVPEWADRRKEDKRPQAALEAVEAWLVQPTSLDTLAQCKATAKACTAARGETFGDQHRVPEAARALAWAVGPKEAAPIFDALAASEEELLARIALTSEYHLGPQQRRNIVDTLRSVLMPPEATEEAVISKSPAGPAPYSADGHFELGQHVIHKKFGDVVVTSVGETWIEVELPDASKKRLAHKP